MNTIPTHKEPTCTLQQGRVPLLVSMPHIGTAIAPDLRAHYMPRALQVEDTDWHLERLYNFLGELGASVLTPTLSRYVIDQNASFSGTLYVARWHRSAGRPPL